MLVSKSEFARHVKVKPPTITNAIKTGRLTETNGKLDLEKSLIAWEENRKAPYREGKKGRPAIEPLEVIDPEEAPDGSGLTLNEWNIRKTAAQAKKIEMDLERARGELLSADRVSMIWTDAIMKMRAKIGTIPNKGAPLCAHKTPKEIKEILTRLTDEALNEVANITTEYEVEI